MHHTRINCLITRDIQNNFVELNVTRDETVDTRVKHFPKQPEYVEPDGNHITTVASYVAMITGLQSMLHWTFLKLDFFGVKFGKLRHRNGAKKKCKIDI